MLWKETMCSSGNVSTAGLAAVRMTLCYLDIYGLYLSVTIPKYPPVVHSVRVGLFWYEVYSCDMFMDCRGKSWCWYGGLLVKLTEQQE